jgi:hypothetical protein
MTESEIKNYIERFARLQNTLFSEIKHQSHYYNRYIIARSLLTGIQTTLKFLPFDMLLLKFENKITKHRRLYYFAVRKYCLISDLTYKIKNGANLVIIEQQYQKALGEYEEYCKVKSSFSSCTPRNS